MLTDVSSCGCREEVGRIKRVDCVNRYYGVSGECRLFLGIGSGLVIGIHRTVDTSDTLGRVGSRRVRV